MDLGPLQALWSQTSSNGLFERSKTSYLPSPSTETNDGVYQKPLFFDTAQKYAHVLGNNSAILQAYSLDNESVEIPVAKASVQKDEIDDVYLTPVGSNTNFGALDGESEGLMDLPLSLDNKDLEDNGWLYSLHNASVFDITNMFNIDRNDDANDALSLPTEIRTDTSWSKEIDGFFDPSATESTIMDFSPAVLLSSGSKMTDDQQFCNLFGSNECDFLAQTLQSEQVVSGDYSTNKQGSWLSEPVFDTSSPEKGDVSIPGDCKTLVIPTEELNVSTQPVAQIADSHAGPSLTATSVLEALLKTPADTDLPSTPDAKTPQIKGSKPKGPMLLFGKHENEIMAKLKEIKKSEKKSLKNKLVTIPVEEFNSLLEQSHLSEIEVAFMKEWRRRGKNKTAAQFARKRRREEMSGLDVEVDQLKRQYKEMIQRHEQLTATVTTYKNKTLQLESELFGLHNTVGGVINRDTRRRTEGNLFFVQRTESQTPVPVQ